MDQWYITRGEVKKGPFSFAQLQAAAAKGAVRDTDKLLQAGGQQWIAARQVAGLFPAPAGQAEMARPAEVQAAAPAGPSRPTVSRLAFVAGSAAAAAMRLLKKGDWLRVTRDFLQRFVVSLEASSLFRRAGTSRSQAWQRIAAVSIGLCLCVVATFLIFGGKSRPAKTADSAAFRPPDLDLPRVGPTKPPAQDRVMLEFKTARAGYLAAMSKARDDLFGRYFGVSEEIKNSDLDPQEKDRTLKRLLADHNTGRIHTHPAMKSAVADYVLARANAARKFGEVAAKGLIAYEKAGVTDPAKLRPLQAARLAGEHPDLLGIWGAVLPQRPGLLGALRPVRQSWHVGVDEKSGGWVVSGFEIEPNMAPRAAWYGQNIQFKDGVLTFIAAPIEDVPPKTRSLLPTAPPRQGGAAGFGARSSPRSKSPAKERQPEAAQAESSAKPAGNVVTLKPDDGELDCETQVSPLPTKLVLARTDEERHHDYFDRYEKTTIRRLDAATETPDANNANYVWHRVAQRASFACYPSYVWTPLEHEALYLPYRRDHVTMTPGANGALTDLLLGGTSGAGVNEGRAMVLLREYEGLWASPDPYLKRMIDQAVSICRYRLRLALADEEFGNTVASSLRSFQQDVFVPALKYGFQREADVAELRDSVQREHPGVNVIVTDAPMSEESKAKWHEFIKGAGGIMEDIEHRGEVSGMLAYADMAQVDRTAAFWQTWLLPLASRAGGPVSSTPLVNVHGVWSRWTFKHDFQRLGMFQMQNLSGQDLTHVVLELIAENEWGDKAAHYYYFNQFDVADWVNLVPHLRWVKRRLDFTNTISLTWSLWADQASEVSRKVKLTNPVPNPDPAGWRKDYLKYDEQYQAKGEALGAVMQDTMSLPFNPDRQRRLLRAAAAPRMSYAFRLQGESGRTLVLRFLRFDRDHDTFEAEIFDLRTRKPFDAQTTIWKGKLNARPEAGISFDIKADGTESAWAFGFMRDDQPVIFCRAAGRPEAVFPTRNILLFEVEVP